MTSFNQQHQRVLQDLPNISFRQLETLQMVSREGSYTNAAHELRITRANVKRICSNLEKEAGHEIFIEDKDKLLTLSRFGTDLLTMSASLTRNFIHLREGIYSIQRKGLILRLAASDEFFCGRSFSYALKRVEVQDLYRPCYYRIETNRFKAALLSSECDIYFGVGISTSKRLELIDLERVPWSFHPSPNYSAQEPTKPSDLTSGKWVIEPVGDNECSKTVLDELLTAGAQGGRILKDGEIPKDDEILLRAEPSRMGLVNPQDKWPTFLFSAAMKKQHPYAELINRLKRASRV